MSRRADLLAVTLRHQHGCGPGFSSEVCCCRLQILLACMMEEYEALRKAAALAGADMPGSDPGAAEDKIKAA